MVDRSEDWLTQADADLRLARGAMALESFEWSCFASQHAAEKALPALFMRLGAEAWGHAVSVLLANLGADVAVPAALIDAAKRLDKHYIPTRYPNGFDEGAPTEYYTRDEAAQAIEDGQSIVDFCRRAMGAAG